MHNYYDESFIWNTTAVWYAILTEWMSTAVSFMSPPLRYVDHNVSILCRQVKLMKVCTTYNYVHPLSLHGKLHCTLTILKMSTITIVLCIQGLQCVVLHIIAILKENTVRLLANTNQGGFLLCSKLNCNYPFTYNNPI